jgi:hypothetical protein
MKRLFSLSLRAAGARFSTLRQHEVHAKAQGGAFIVEVINRLLDKPDVPESRGLVQLVGATPDLEVSKGKLRERLRATFGNDCRLLVHLDEHGKMCAGAEVDESHDFDVWRKLVSRGVMETLNNSNVSVVATFIAPLELSRDKSSSVCRQPKAVPAPDPDQIMQQTAELRFDLPDDFTYASRTERRLWASLRFALVMKIKYDVRLQFLHYRPEGSEYARQRDFLSSFEEARKKYERMVRGLCDLSQREAVLEECIACCKLWSEFGVADRINQYATNLLLSVDDDALGGWEHRVSDLVVLPNDKITSSLPSLLQMHDPECHIYSRGSRHFHNFMEQGLSGYPLEAAYAWVLGVRLEKMKEVQFRKHGPTFEVSGCKNLSPYRILVGESSALDVNKIKKLEKGVLYRTNETTKGETSQRNVDIWFLTEADELVLVDVYCGNLEKTAKKKARQLQRTVNRVNREPQLACKAYGVVLAPGVDCKSFLEDGVDVSCQPDATALLGGLNQMSPWLVYSETGTNGQTMRADLDAGSH